MASFSAALLVGGASRRMGRNKALLPVAGFAHLWQRQWRVLEELGAKELLWAGPPLPGMPGDARMVLDVVERAGPLGGLGACLGAMHGDLLVVLAVDLPEMTAPFLRRLLEKADGDCGAVMSAGGHFEPMAAVYPRRLEVLARDHLKQGRHAMYDFIGAAMKQEAMRAFPLAAEDEPLFHNLNSPADL